TKEQEMDRLRATIGLCVLCVVGCSALAVQGAGAVTFGTTGFTCAKGEPPANLWGEHCLTSNPEGGEAQEFGHKEINAGKTTHAILTNEKTKNKTTAAQELFLKATIATIPIKFEATVVSSTKGWLENRTNGSEHYTIGEGVLHFQNIKVIEPANCKVVQGAKTGEVETTQLVAHTKGQTEAEMFLQAEPAAGAATSFAEFEIANNGGTCAAAQKVKLVGSVKCKRNGATIEFTHEEVTTQGKLRFGSAVGPKFGLEGKITIKAGEGKEEEGKSTNPVAATTVNTP
ncbi:MAG TPA: hypothetical protein VMS11_02110, partial [Solirubrobacterales bacterium]|nr:hypothetical protein [Solirubrobacterales bacterium]